LKTRAASLRLSWGIVGGRFPGIGRRKAGFQGLEDFRAGFPDVGNPQAGA
jgi:hypothetical protein